MANYALSREADLDVETIAEDSIRNWGVARTETYILDMEFAFQRLASFPDIGTDANYIRPGYKSWLSGSHVVFYTKTETEVLIIRILHQRMDFQRHFIKPA